MVITNSFRMTSTLILSFSILCTTYFHSSVAVDCWESCTGDSRYSSNSTYGTNLDNVLSTLIRQALSTGFSSTSIGQNEDQVHAIYLCRADTLDCSSCVYNARSNMSSACPSKMTAFIWCDYCMIGYSNAPISEDGTSYVITNPKNVTGSYNTSIENNLKSLVPKVVNSSIKYGTEGSSVVYSLGQCMTDLSEDECKQCMQDAIALLPRYIGARVFLPRCNIRYESSQFYGDAVHTAFFLLPNSTNSTLITENGNHKKRSYTHIIVAVTTVFGALLLCGAGYLIYLQKRRRHHPGLKEINATESLQFEFRTIKEATNNFSVYNKLGQGGFGSVYRGRLQNGQEIAVKRLSIDSRQGIEEFKTEVLLLAKLQHKNLVRLLGFCLHSEEKLLIYELLPNASLDKVLLGSSYHATLAWDTRYKVLVGIARGILYLHEDSRLKIIHRDLKSSNILLDQSMNPKIADFGLARLVATDQIHAVTSNVMGTRGYMPPEYTRTGRFSIKTDVYSFGIIILEMLSGHKCNSTTFPYEEESLPQRAWRLWKEGTTLDLVDGRLNGNFSGEEVTRSIHIGMLCIQEDPNKRPTMAPIVSALNGHPVAFSEPEPPQDIVPTGFSSGHSSILTNTTESGRSRGLKSSTEVSKNMDDITDLYPR